MYSPKIYPDQIEKLYRIRCVTYALDQPQSMVAMVAEALNKYLPTKERAVNREAIQKGIHTASAVRLTS